MMQKTSGKNSEVFPGPRDGWVEDQYRSCGAGDSRPGSEVDISLKRGKELRIDLPTVRHGNMLSSLVLIP